MSALFRVEIVSLYATIFVSNNLMIDLLVSICVVIVCLVSSSSIALSCVVKVSFAVFKLFIVSWFAVINWFNSVIFAELSVP